MAPSIPPPKPKTLPVTPPEFTVDSDVTRSSSDMPSITRLLNRQSLALPPKPTIKPPPPPPAPPRFQPAKAPAQEEISLVNTMEASIRNMLSEDTRGFRLESEATTKTSEPLTAKIVPIKRSTRKSLPDSKPLVRWTLQGLQSETDPLAQGILQLIQRGASIALFLAIHAPTSEVTVPHFVSTAALEGHDKMALWTGLRWDPRIVPELWNHFLKAGFVELPPPGTMTNVASHRNVVRGAFGITPTEWLLLVQVGSIQSCRGVVALISSASLLSELKHALPFLAADLPKAA